MASAMTTEFVRTSYAEASPFSLIEQKSLVSRLIEEIREAAKQLARNPRGFLSAIVSPDNKDEKRRQRIYVGLSFAVMVHAALIVLVAVLGWRTMFVKASEKTVGDVIWIPISNPSETPDAAESVAPRGKKEGGGSGGGDRNPLPATKGPLPQMSTSPQIVKPNTPSAKAPTIQLPPTIVGPDGAPPPPGPVGVPMGVIAEAPSPGPGEGEGLGGRKGSGAGPGSGPGSGKGSDGGAGDKARPGLPGGRDDFRGPIPYNLIRNFPDSNGIVWIHRARPIVTPEARANKVSGEVWLRATFREDGTITNIEVIREVPYMTESAIEALQRSTFRPATVKGRPVTVTNVPVRINVDAVFVERSSKP